MPARPPACRPDAAHAAPSDWAEGFAPVVDARTRALVLGSMPGRASLARAAYYAHPRNAFWPLMRALFGVPAEGPIEARYPALLAAGVGLWDVLGACHRPGSLDGAIRMADAETRPLAALLDAHPRIHALAFNGATAARVFRQRIAPTLAPGRLAGLRLLAMPSTSPAHASLDLAAKRAAWAALREALAG